MNAIEKLESFLTAEKQFYNCYDIILEILVIYNCRISEILSADWNNFNQQKFLCLLASKGSASIIIRDRKILNAIASLPRINQTKIFPYVSYYQVYHHIKKNYSHLLSGIRIKKNMKITHAFRYQNINGIENEDFIRDILHHRSIRSGKYYINKIKGV